MSNFKKHFFHKIHTWFCLSYFLKTNIKFYCIYQYFMSINSFFQHRICFSIQLQLQLVNLHRNRRYFVIKLHTWFCLSYFLTTNITCYCIYQYFMSINSSFNTISVSRYNHLITVTRDPDWHIPPVFSSPGPKVQVNYCHHLASVVCRL